MKKVSRFEALAKGLSCITTAIKKKQVSNVIEKARLSSECAVAELDSKIEETAKRFISEPSEGNLTRLSELIQNRMDAVSAIELSDHIKSYLDEEVEVEDEKKK